MEGIVIIGLGLCDYGRRWKHSCRRGVEQSVASIIAKQRLSGGR